MRTRFTILFVFLLYRIALAQSPEQINLQLDQSYYVAGSKISVQADVLDAQTLKPSQLSIPLYIEWVDLKNGIVLNQWILQLDSLSHAKHSFRIDKNLPSGYYQVRAYTQWSRNFEVVSQNVLVLALTETPNTHKTVVDTTLQVSHQPLVDQIWNRLELQLTDNFGNSLSGEATLFDSLNKALLTLNLPTSGKGVMDFKPEKNQRYYLKTGQKTYNLPPVQSEGSVLMLDSKTDKRQIRLRIENNYAASNDTLILMALVKGKPILERKISSSQNRVFTFATDSLPKGTLHVWLLHAQKGLITQTTALEEPTERQLFSYETLHKPLQYPNEHGIVIKGKVKLPPKANPEKVELSMLLESAEQLTLFDSELKIGEVQPDGTFAFEELLFRKKAKVSIRASYKNKLLGVEIDSLQSPAVQAQDLPIDWRPFQTTVENIQKRQETVIQESLNEGSERLLELEEVVINGKKKDVLFGLEAYKAAQTVKPEIVQIYAGLTNEDAFDRLFLQYVRPTYTDIVKIAIDGDILPMEYSSVVNFINIAKIDVYRGPEIMSSGATILVNFVTKKSSSGPTIAYSVSFIKRGFE
jgi:hypothetical protein